MIVESWQESQEKATCSMSTTATRFSEIPSFRSFEIAKHQMSSLSFHSCSSTEWSGQSLIFCSFHYGTFMSLYPHLTFSAFYSSFHFPSTTPSIPKQMMTYPYFSFVVSYSNEKYKVHLRVMNLAIPHYFYLYFWRDGTYRWCREAQELQFLSETRPVLRRNFCKFSDTNRTMYVLG